MREKGLIAHRAPADTEGCAQITPILRERYLYVASNFKVNKAADDIVLCKGLPIVLKLAVGGFLCCAPIAVRIHFLSQLCTAIIHGPTNPDDMWVWLAGWEVSHSNFFLNLYLKTHPSPVHPVGCARSGPQVSESLHGERETHSAVFA